MLSHFLLLLVLLPFAQTQPPGGGPPGGGGGPPGGAQDVGSTAATGCNPMPSACASDGSIIFVNSSLTYLNGKFSGTIKTNLCPNKALPAGINAPSPSCIEQTYPATTTVPAAAH